MNTSALSFCVRGNKKKYGFTLAEVLITLSIIGVVAALTIPILVKNMNDYAFGKAKDTFDMKITEAMNQMKTNNEMDGYPTSDKFVDAFAKYMKISYRCDASNLSKCFSPQIYASDDTLIDTAAKLRTGADFGKDTYTSPLVGVQFSNGTTALISYDPACVAQDAFNNQAVATGCLSMLYDVNGFSKPNKAGKDIKLFNVDQLGASCAFKVGGTCYGTPFSPTGLSLADCTAKKDSLGINGCFFEPDYWAGAVKQCGGISKMPTTAQLDTLTNDLLGVSSCSGGAYCTGTLDNAKATTYGLPTSNIFIWTGEEISVAGSNERTIINSSESWVGNNNRGDSILKAVCIQ